MPIITTAVYYFKINLKFSYISANTEMTQRERLSEQLDKGTLECLVCCERVKQTDSVWCCSNCYHVFHLRCIRKWAISSMVGKLSTKISNILLVTNNIALQYFFTLL